MRTRLRHVWEVLTTGYWFVPGVMSVAAVLMAIALLYIDVHGLGPAALKQWLYGGGADGASTLLSAVAGSVATVAGVAFSITVAALSQASSQFGPRLLRNFMRDTGNHVVLGTFVGTFLYCLLVLRTVHGGDGGPGGGRAEFVPQASVTVGVVLAALSMGMLIYFIHHVSTSLQAPMVVAAVAADLGRAIERMAAEQGGSAVPTRLAEAGAAGLPAGFEAGAGVVASGVDGYVQVVDFDALVGEAAAHDLVLRVERVAGQHVMEGDPLLRVWPRGAPDLDRRLAGAFIVGPQRTPEQDVEFAIDQLVEVAVRALSPGVNDPFTAMNCVDTLGSALCRIARRGLPGPYRYDAAGRLRVVAPVTTFGGAADAAFNQIRQYGSGSVAVMVRMLEVLGRCGCQVSTDEQRRVLLRHAEMVYAEAGRVTRSGHDMEDLRRRWERVRGGMGGAGAGIAVDSAAGRATAREPGE